MSVMKRLSILLFISLLIGSISSAEPISVKDKVGKTEYEALLPETYDKNDKDTKYSLIMVLHGANGQIEWMMDYWYSSPAAKECIIVCPHLKYIGEMHVDIFSRIDKVLRHIKKKYNIDKNEMYLTGFSAGADSALFYAIEHPKVFKAIALAAFEFREDVFYNPYYSINNLKDLSFLVLQGELDDTISKENFNITVKELKKHGAKVEYEILDIGHDYEMPQVMKTFEYFEKFKEKEK